MLTYVLNKMESAMIVPIKFKVHIDLIKEFHSLQMEYAQKNKIFALSNNEMFAVMVAFMYETFKQKKILKLCPSDFSESVIRPGKRKATARTVTFPYADVIIFKITKATADKYMDVMYSYICNDPKDNIFNTHHSRTHFFYDFLQYMTDRKTDLMKFVSAEKSAD